MISYSGYTSLQNYTRQNIVCLDDRHISHIKHIFLIHFHGSKKTHCYAQTLHHKKLRRRTCDTKILALTLSLPINNWCILSVWPAHCPRSPQVGHHTVYVFWTISVGPTRTPFRKWLCKKIACIVAINTWNIYYQPSWTIYWWCLSLDFWSLSTISRPIYTSTKAISCFSENKNGSRKVANMASSYKTNLKRHLFVK